jgi:sulfur carrier protein
MQLIVNGSSRNVADRTVLAELVVTISDRATGIAVARNGEVVPRSIWPSEILSEGDRVDVVTAVQGG